MKNSKELILFIIIYIILYLAETYILKLHPNIVFAAVNAIIAIFLAKFIKKNIFKN